MPWVMWIPSLPCDVVGSSFPYGTAGVSLVCVEVDNLIDIVAQGVGECRYY